MATKPKNPRKDMAKPSRPKTAGAAAKNKVALTAKPMPRGSAATAAKKRASVKPSPSPTTKSSGLSKVEPKAGPRKFKTTMTKSPEGKANIARISSKKTGDQNFRENYNASRDSKYPRVKDLSSSRADNGAGRRFMRKGGTGK